MEPETLEQIIEAVRSASEPHFLEIVAWTTTPALLLAAIGALIYTANQVHAMKEANKGTALQVRAMTEANKSASLQAHAALLLELDRRWNETAMVDAQQKIGKLMREIDAKAEARWKHLPPKDIRDRSQDLYAEEMKRLSENGGSPYQEYMRLIVFLEMLGYVARKGYLPKADTINLFGGTILACRRVFYGHIKQIQAKPGTTGRAWEHAVWLMDEVRRVADDPKN